MPSVGGQGQAMPDQAERLPEMRSVGVVLVVALATVLHAAGWFFVHERVSPPNVVGQLASVSFSPIAAGQDGEKDVTSEEQIRSDLAVIAPYTRAIRTYSVSNGLEAVPELASEFGLHVTLGAWIDDGEEAERERDRDRDRAQQTPSQHRQHHRRQRNALSQLRAPSRAWRSGSDRQDPAGETPSFGAGHHGRGVEHLA